MIRQIVPFVLLLMVSSGQASGQNDEPAGPVRTSLPTGFRVDTDSLPHPRWWWPVASVIVPGSGQLAAGHHRGAVYLALEAVLLVQLFSARSEAIQERDRYRDLAFDVARAPFAPARRDTVFEYFEQLDRFVESGPFDSDPGPALVPPADELTYNGSVWKLARETFLPDPSFPDTTSQEYQRALDFYRSRAVGPNFQWSWRDAGLEQDLYSRSIKRSDDAFRSSTQYLGFLLANHLLSAIDAFVSYRLGRAGSPARLQSSLAWIPGSSGSVETRVGVVFSF